MRDRQGTASAVGQHRVDVDAQLMVDRRDDVGGRDGIGFRVAGDRVGLIKFGSRCDILLGPEWEITAKIGSRVVAGESVIARMREAV